MATSLQSQGVTVVVAALVLALVAAGCFLALTVSLASTQSAARSGEQERRPSAEVELFVPRQRTVRVESVVVTDPGPGAEWGRWERTGERPRRALPPARDRVL